MRKQTFLALLAALLLGVNTLQAVPSYPAKRIVKLSDGTAVEATLTGDEHLHYYSTAEGRSYFLQADNSFREVPATELQTLRQQAISGASVSNARRVARLPRRVGTFTHYTGTKKGIVILVNFQDNTFTVPEPQQFFNRYFNEEGFNDYNFQGSVADYFSKQSYGQFTIDFDVVGPYTVSKAMGAYGSPSSNSNDTDPQSMVREACKLADADVNFADYDWDGDGQVDQVFVIYAGYGEAQGAPSTTIWPHESSLSNLTLDNTSIHTYACSCELQGSGGGTIPDGIGTACHEFSHCLGYPDFYNTSTGGSASLSYYDLLCSGCYNSVTYNGTKILGACPAGYTAYERWMAGWLTPTELKGGENITGMKALSTTPEAYVLYNDANPNEYYLLENRQLQGFDSSLYGHGLIITHIDYDESAWTQNAVNTISGHERYGLVCADGVASRTSVAAIAGDPFPGTKNVTSFTDFTSPAATLFNANTDGTSYLHKFIENIKESITNTISFNTVWSPLLDEPSPEVQDITSDGFTVVWPFVDRAESYSINLTEIPAKKSPAESLLLQEDFQNCYKSTAGLSDISSKLASYLSTSGFSGSALYQSPNYLRFGTSSKQGNLYTPAIDSTSTGNLTVVMKMKPFAQGTQVTGNVKIVNRISTSPAKYDSESLPFAFAQDTTLVFHSGNVLNDLFQVSIFPESRCYISYLALYDGSYDAEELGLTSGTAVKSPRRVKSTLYSTDSDHYTFSGLDNTCTYTVYVRAINSRRTSEWSEGINVQLSGDDEDALRLTPAQQCVTPWYDLQGRRVTAPAQHGIYIKDGKKILR